MAEVDFTNARIAPATSYPGGSTAYNPTYDAYVSLTKYNKFVNAGGGNITSSFNRTTVKDQQKQFVLMYNGTFSANGTEFYILGDAGAWRVYNITFSSGDTFVFSIKADLICQ